MWAKKCIFAILNEDENSKKQGASVLCMAQAVCALDA